MDPEYISEWPPVSSGRAHLEEVGEELTVTKRPKLDESGHCQCEATPEPLLHLAQCSPAIKAEALLAQWWKKAARKTCKVEETSNNPKTKLFHISRLNEAKSFLRHRINYLTPLRDGPESHDVNLSLATCYHMLGPDLQYTLPALQYAESALETATEDREEIAWLLELLGRQRTAETGKEKGREVVEKWSSEQLKMPEYTQVERRAHSELSRAEFRERYAKTHTPVIITGCVASITSEPWTLDYIRETIGHKIAPLKRVISGSVEWARLEEAGETEVGKFIESLDSPEEDPKYLFDWSLPLHCPELVAGLKTPDYFANNIFLRTPDSSLYHNSWPSLFIAPAGITSELHVDAFCSNFWMALFEGRKRWVFFPPEDLPFLYPVYCSSMDATFECDLSRGSEGLASHPLLALTHPRECVLGAGELLFVPFGCPHRVENLTKSLAISANFVDGSNLAAVKQELKVNGLLDPRAENLLKVIEDLGC